MKIFVALVLLCLPLRLSAAVGDLIGLEVETNGWVLRATISGLNTNGMFYSGLRTNGTPNLTNNLTLSVTGSGYVGTTPASPGRTLYATKHLRFPYPLEQTNDFNAQGSDVVIRLSLSEYVCAGDTVTATARAGYYASTNGTGTNANAFTAQTVTNSSTQISPAPFGKWAVVPMQQITNSTMRVKSSDWHWAARDGKPVAAVKYTAIDEHSNTNSVTVTSMTWDPALRAAVYVADLDISTFTNGDKIQISRTVYPWIGTNLFQTTNGAHVTSPYYTLTNLADHQRRYGNSYALVDAANGSSSGVAVSHTNWNPSAVPAPFQTIDQALAACRLSNSIWFAHSDVGGAIVVLTNGSYTFTGGGSSYGTNARTMSTITRHPSASRLLTIIGNQSGNDNAGYWVRINGIHNTNNTTLNFWNSGGFTWWDDCQINTTGTTFQYGETPQYMTSCVVSNHTQGLRGYSTRSAPAPLVAGNDFFIAEVADAYCVIGNYWMNQQQNGAVGDTHSSSPDPSAVGGIIYNNQFYQVATANGVVALGQSNSIGFALAQNVFEQTNNAGPVLTIWGDGNTNTCVQLLMWHNLSLGQRFNYNYQDTGGHFARREFIRFDLNFIDDYNLKTDLFTGSGGANGARLGNWAGLFGVHHFYNVKAETPGVGAAGSFLNSQGYGFEGISSWSTVTDTNWPAFRDRKAYDGANILRGLGDYRLRSTSPMWGVNGLRLISHDITGNPRGLLDPPGPHSVGNPKKGGFF